MATSWLILKILGIIALVLVGLILVFVYFAMACGIIEGIEEKAARESNLSDEERDALFYEHTMKDL